MNFPNSFDCAIMCSIEPHCTKGVINMENPITEKLDGLKSLLKLIARNCEDREAANAIDGVCAFMEQVSDEIRDNDGN